MLIFASETGYTVPLQAEDRQTQSSIIMAKLAVLDIGTNSIHMVLAEVEPDFSYKILDRFKDMTRLGDGAFRTRRLSEAAMARALEVIQSLTTLARNKGYDRIKAVATSAVREARNGGEFIEEIARRTKLRVRVVTGQEEARLIYLGVRHSMDLSDQPTLAVDVGGGSVELIVGNRQHMMQAQSLKLGAIRLKDLYLKQDPSTPSSRPRSASSRPSPSNGSWRPPAWSATSPRSSICAARGARSRRST
jgi:exopolyphosphatase / guanosine-5'-triphosphate,3'-diphosphate pyrophosphatase